MKTISTRRDAARSLTIAPPFRLFFFGLALLLLSYPAAQAALITSAPSGGVTTTFPGGNTPVCTSATPLTLSGFTVSPVTTQAHGASTICGNYSFLNGIAGNGTWSNFSMVLDNDGASVFQIDLGGLFSSAGGFMNYLPNAAAMIAGVSDVTIAAFDANHQLLESYDLLTAAPISTGPNSFNAGAFRGIQRSTADIRYLQIGGDFALMHDLTLTPPPSAAVPEPATAFPLMVAGLAVVLIRRSR